jgi:hypothetical protein
MVPIKPFLISLKNKHQPVPAPIRILKLEKIIKESIKTQNSGNCSLNTDLCKTFSRNISSLSNYSPSKNILDPKIDIPISDTHQYSQAVPEISIDLDSIIPVAVYKNVI